MDPPSAPAEFDTEVADSTSPDSAEYDFVANVVSEWCDYEATPAEVDTQYAADTASLSAYDNALSLAPYEWNATNDTAYTIYSTAYDNAMSLTDTSLSLDDDDLSFVCYVDPNAPHAPHNCCRWRNGLPRGSESAVVRSLPSRSNFVIPGYFVPGRMSVLNSSPPDGY